MIDLKSLRRELRHLFNGNLERADEARLVLGRMLPEGLKLRRNARGRLQVRYGLKLIDLPARDGSGGEQRARNQAYVRRAGAAGRSKAFSRRRRELMPRTNRESR